MSNQPDTAPGCSYPLGGTVPRLFSKLMLLASKLNTAENPISDTVVGESCLERLHIVDQFCELRWSDALLVAISFHTHFGGN